jgi:WD40 repeat protein
LSYSDDGKSIVVASENWLTTVIDLSGAPDPSGDYPYQEYRGGNGKLPTTPSVVAVDINEKYVLIADKDTKQVILRSRADLDKYQTLKHKYRVYTAKFSPDNKLVLTGCDDGNTYLWDISGDSLTYRLLKGHEAKVVAVDFSPDGKYILTGSYDNSAALYELNNTSVGSLTPTIKMEGINATFSGHTSDVNVVTFAHQVQDATYHFFTGSSDRTGKYWEYKKGSLRELPSVIRHQDEITVGGFLSGDSMIVTGGFDETLRIWRAGDDQVENLIKERIQ